MYDGGGKHVQAVLTMRERARILAWLLGGFVVLMFFITIAKTGINH